MSHKNYGNRTPTIHPKPERRTEMTIKYGHDGERVVVVFSQRTDNLQLTLPQLEEFMTNLKTHGRDKLIEYQKEKNGKH